MIRSTSRYDLEMAATFYVEKTIGSLLDVGKGDSCPVCGDQVSGYHYGLQTCESCKGFFKRTVQNKKSYTCTGSSRCIITKTQRKNCPFCRFRKCLDVGMKVEAVRENRVRGGRNKFGPMYKYQRALRLHAERQREQVRAQVGNHLLRSTCNTDLAYRICRGEDDFLRSGYSVLRPGQGSSRSLPVFACHVDVPCLKDRSSKRGLAYDISGNLVQREYVERNLDTSFLDRSSLFMPRLERLIPPTTGHDSHAISLSTSQGLGAPEGRFRSIDNNDDHFSPDSPSTVPTVTAFQGQASDLSGRRPDRRISDISVPPDVDLPKDLRIGSAENSIAESMALGSRSAEELRERFKVGAGVIIDEFRDAFVGGSDVTVEDDARHVVQLLCRMTDLALFLTIEWTRTADLFKNLKVEHQMKLFANCWCELLVIDLLFLQTRHDRTEHLLTMSGHLVSLDMFEVVGIGQLKKIFQELIRTLRSLRLRQDEVTCLKFIVLLNPDAGDVNDHFSVEKSQERVSALLLDYCNSVSPSRFGQLLTQLPEIQAFSLQLENYLYQRWRLGGYVPQNSVLADMLRSSRR